MGYALCLFGSFVIGYGHGIQTIAGSINGLITFGSGDTPNLAALATNATTIYIQQNVNPTLGLYLPVGIALILGGFILIVRGDQKPKSAEERGQVPSQTQPLIAKSRN
jgi:hypothetical protein